LGFRAAAAGLDGDSARGEPKKFSPSDLLIFL
jgi:hypothetical protein